MALDETLRVQLLGRHVERRRRVREVARLEVLDRDLDGDVLVRGDRRAVGRALELGRRHLGLRRDETHRRLVAGALDDLLPVRLGDTRELHAEVDEVVRRGDRGLLASGGVGATVRRELVEDVARVDGQGRLGVRTSGRVVTARVRIVTTLTSVRVRVTSSGAVAGRYYACETTAPTTFRTRYPPLLPAAA